MKFLWKTWKNVVDDRQEVNQRKADTNDKKPRSAIEFNGICPISNFRQYMFKIIKAYPKDPNKKEITNKKYCMSKFFIHLSVFNHFIDNTKQNKSQKY